MKTLSNRIETKYNKVVNIAEDGEITVLSETFDYSDGFKGATGNKFYPVTESDIQDRISEYEDNDTELLIYYAENFGDLTADMIRNVDSSREALLDLFFDRSYDELWDYLREVIGETDENSDSYPVFFECTGGGRCFDKDFQGNYNVELSETIRELEKK